MLKTSELLIFVDECDQVRVLRLVVLWLLSVRNTTKSSVAAFIDFPLDGIPDAELHLWKA